MREHLLLKQTQLAIHAADPRFADFTRLVQETPALRDYAHHMWTRHEAALARAVAAAVGAPEDDVSCAALAHFALEARSLVLRHPEPRRAAEEAFALLEHGWAATHPGN